MDSINVNWIPFKSLMNLNRQRMTSGKKVLLTMLPTISRKLSMTSEIWRLYISLVEKLAIFIYLGHGSRFK